MSGRKQTNKKYAKMAKLDEIFQLFLLIIDKIVKKYKQDRRGVWRMKLKRKTPRRKKIFNRLLLTSSITIIATVSILFIMISNYYSEVIIQREMDLNNRILDRVDEYFIEKENDVTNMIRGLYTDNVLVEDLSYALQNGYEDYLKYRLDRYTASSNFLPTDINVYFKGYFNQHDDVNALSLHSLKSSYMEYLFIYNHSRWDRSIVSETKPNIMMDDLAYPSYDERVKREFQDTFTVKRNINSPVTRDVIGTLSVYFTTEKLDQLINNSREEVNSTIFLLHEEDGLLYASNSDISSEIIKDIPKVTGDEVIKWEGNTYYVNTLVSNNEYKYIGVIPQKELNQLNLAKGTTWILITISTFIAIFITYTSMRNYSSRIDHIDGSIREVENGNLDIRIHEFKQNDELTTISESFNAMLDELTDYIDRYYIANIKQQEAELKALQSQINPHFLFNTLEVIRMTAVIEGSKTSSKMIYHLSRLFKYTLKTEETVPLHIELEHTNQYLQLIQLQHPNKLTVLTDVPTEIENISIQKLILQPLIENFMVHGFQKDRDDNQLEIRAVQIDDKVKIKIKDNGQGLSEERLAKVIDHIENEDDTTESIGLKNVHQRLRLKHGQDYGLTIQSKAGIETIVTIVIPLGG